MKHGVSVDQAKNRLYIILDGFFTDADVQKVSVAVYGAINSLQPGFDMVTDVTTCRPATPAGSTEIEKTQQYAIDKGARRFVRVVSERILIQMQINRGAAKAGIKANYVKSIAEANALLDKLET
jgi:hypothetical protein